MSAPVSVFHVEDGPADARVVVFSNSLGSTLAMWEPQVPGVAETFRALRYDLRGHGRSPVPPGPYDVADLGSDLVRLLDRRGVERAHLCGISIGGLVSMWVAAHFPERVGRIVLCCTSADFGDPEAWHERARSVRASGTGAVADGVVGRWFTPRFAERNPELLARMRTMIASTPAEGYAACCSVVERADLRPDLSAIAAPTLVIAGADDPAAPIAHAERIAEGIGGAKMVVVEGAAHLANVEQPERVTDLILEHLRGP